MPPTKPPIRELSQLLGIVHNLTYYAPEMGVFRDRGIRRYWHGYMAFRSAPMGRVTAPTVTATFYNFAPSLVAAAMPAVWDVVTPEDAMALRDGAMAHALDRTLGPSVSAADVVSLADPIIEALVDVSPAGRVLFAAHQELPVPPDPLMRLWHGATLWREYRGDGHNMALVAAGLDGIECHVLLAGRGIADQPTIEKIRGWTKAEWDAAHDRLAGRGLIGSDGPMTDAGRDLRREIETETDRLATPPFTALRPDADRLLQLLRPMVGTLVDSGAVAGTWPPPEPARPA